MEKHVKAEKNHELKGNIWLASQSLLHDPVLGEVLACYQNQLWILMSFQELFYYTLLVHVPFCPIISTKRFERIILLKFVLISLKNHTSVVVLTYAVQHKIMFQQTGKHGLSFLHYMQLKVFAAFFVLLQQNSTEINIFRRQIKFIFFKRNLRKLSKFALSTEVFIIRIAITQQ